MLVIEFDTHQPDLLLGLLSSYPFEGFEEIGNTVLAYMENTAWQELGQELPILVGEIAAIRSVETLPAINWNAQWEASFLPVAIDRYCLVRASFHPAQEGFVHEIVIDPRMAFGTGHHETTELMIRQMQLLPMTGMTVLDLGCGTGILAILAARCGAGRIMAVDHDTEAVANAIENVRINCVTCQCLRGTLSDLTVERFDIILANINRNTILSLMKELPRHLTNGGFVLISGYLNSDRDRIIEEANTCHFKSVREQSLGEWSAALLRLDHP